MLLQRKIDRAMNWLKEKSNPGQNNSESADKFSEDNSDLYAYDPKAEWKAQESNDAKLEKGDILGILISSLIVFGPIFLILIIILILVFPSFNAIK